MAPIAKLQVRAAQIVLPCSELDATLTFFTERLGFRIETISPADDPCVAELAGHGVRIRLERGVSGSPGVLRLSCQDPFAATDAATELWAPNGTRIQIAAADAELVVPQLRASFVLSRLRGDTHWTSGRAGMSYRDLIPDRQGGRFIASHIRIHAGGPVPDYVHFHEVRFQLIYCYKGWVRLVYEDQGPPFVLHAGDCVLQPPRIRHRVLESSPGLEVIEVGCPARHDTSADYELPLPTPDLRPERDFRGQRFVRHSAATATWQPWNCAGFECRDTGIGAATDGLAGVRIVRPLDASAGARSTHASSHEAELLFVFVTEGSMTVESEQHDAERVGAGDALVIPAGWRHALTHCSEDLELLEVLLPAESHAHRLRAGAE